MEQDLDIPAFQHTFRCVACDLIVTDLNLFHGHLISHIEGKGYYYDIVTRTGHIKFAVVSAGCQTDDRNFEGIRMNTDSFGPEIIPFNTGENSWNKTKFVSIIKQENPVAEEDAHIWDKDLSKQNADFTNTANDRTHDGGSRTPIDNAWPCIIAFKSINEKCWNENDIGSIPEQKIPVAEGSDNRLCSGLTNQDSDCSNTTDINSSVLNYNENLDNELDNKKEDTGSMKLISVNKRKCKKKNPLYFFEDKQKIDSKSKSKKRMTIRQNSLEVKKKANGDDDQLPKAWADVMPRKRKSEFNERRCTRNVRLPFTPKKEEHVQKLYECHLCSTKHKKNWMNLSSHIETIHDGMYQFSCKTCFIPFVSQRMLDNHTENCKDMQIKSFACIECNSKRLFLSEIKFKKHVKNNHDSRNPLKCDVCDVDLLSAYHQRMHMVEHEPERLKCSQCRYEADTIGRYDLHMTSHNRLMASYACIICSKEFADFPTLTSHYYRHLDKEGNYTCEVCGTSFACLKILNSHLRNCLKKFNCKFCDKVFALQSSLDSHTLWHIGNKALMPICDQCGASFASQGSLKRHVLTKHMKEDQDLYKCPQCQKTFATKHCYDRHMRIHDDIYLYSCSFCGKKFRTKWNKEAHERQHTGEKPYACSKCGAKFTHNVQCKAHEAKCDI